MFTLKFHHCGISVCHNRESDIIDELKGLQERSTGRDIKMLKFQCGVYFRPVMFTVATLKELAPKMGGLKYKTVIVTI